MLEHDLNDYSFISSKFNRTPNKYELLVTQSNLLHSVYLACTMASSPHTNYTKQANDINSDEIHVPSPNRPPIPVRVDPDITDHLMSQTNGMKTLTEDDLLTAPLSATVLTCGSAMNDPDNDVLSAEVLSYVNVPHGEDHVDVNNVSKKRSHPDDDSANEDDDYIDVNEELKSPPTKRQRTEAGGASKSRKTKAGNVYTVTGIYGERESTRKLNDTEYLFRWDEWPLHASTWHHASNLITEEDADPEQEAVMIEWKSLSARAKNKRYRQFVRAWMDHNRAYTRSLKTQATQTESDTDTSVEVLDAASKGQCLCKGRHYHWAKFEGVLDDLHRATNYAIIRNQAAMINFITLITYCNQFLNNHKYCSEFTLRCKLQLRRIHEHLMNQAKSYQVMKTEKQGSALLDLTIATTESGTRTTAESEGTGTTLGSSSDRSSDSHSAGTQTENEIVDKDELRSDDSDYDPKENKRQTKNKRKTRSKRNTKNKTKPNAR